MMPDDIGDFTYSLLPYALLSAEQIAIWRPSMAAISRLHQVGNIFYDPYDFLKLVEEGFVVVVGREDWYESPASRAANNDWAKQCPWQIGLDDVLRNLARQDDREILSRRKAIMAARPKGPEWAPEILGKHPELITVTTRILQEKALPDGILRRASSIEGIDAVLSVLSICHNIGNAIEEALGDICFEPSQFAEIVAELGFRKPTLTRKSGLPSNEAIFEATRIVQGLRQFASFREFHRFLNSKNRESVIKGIGPLMLSESAIGQLNQVLDDRNFRPSFSGALPTGYSATIGFAGVGLAVLEGLLSGGLGAFGHAGLALTALGFGEDPLREYGIIPYADEKTKEVKWISQLHSGSSRVTSKKREQLKLIIERIPPSDFKMN